MALVRILSIITSFIFLLNITPYSYALGNTYFFLLSATFIILFLFTKTLNVNYLMFWIVSAALISIVFNDIPDFFRPYARFIAFLLILGLVGPLINTDKLNDFRLKLFNLINKLIIVMVVASFIGFSLGLSFMQGRGGFIGFFSHTMILGPIAAIAMLTSLHLSYKSKTKKEKLFYIVIALISFLTSIVAGSRGALVAGIAGVLFFFYKIYQDRLTRYMRIIFIISAMLIFSFPVWETYTVRLKEKIDYGEQQGDILATRAELWKMRILEFKSSPIIGVGYASVDISISDRFDKSDGKVEPGTSWLAVLSMVGLLGFIPMILLFMGYLKFVYSDKQNIIKTAYLGGVLILFIIHMLSEGYVFSAGAGLFFYLWLFLGILEISKRSDKIISF